MPENILKVAACRPKPAGTKAEALMCDACTERWRRSAELLLGEAERRYLNRDTNYKFLGVCVDDSGPNLRFTPDFSGVSIELSRSAALFRDQAQYQIAHEVIHLLAPERNPPAIMLEEGLAVYFSVDAPQFSHSGYRKAAREGLKSTPCSNYWEALCGFEELVAIEPKAIKLLREQNRHFYSMTPDFIIKVIPDVSKELADRLCERRQMR